MLSLMQVTEAWLFSRAFEGLPDPIVPSDLGAIGSHSELWIRAKKSCNLLSLHLIYVVRIGFQRGINLLELCLNLIPGKGLLLRARRRRHGQGHKQCEECHAHGPPPCAAR